MVLSQQPHSLRHVASYCPCCSPRTLDLFAAALNDIAAAIYFQIAAQPHVKNRGSA
jgi:hypothetical protein